ncbi:ornithine decarboxylase 1-like [Schistocerca piceifrons]|uniref:ornithine decarboxylase 1-like n=1 Tax=Schistocerca piceifrons TaxID=274613 RepID=UPI001F5E61C9|nr:ornithine decarboxylase 1-like [Schistocerca piceifrons]XP_047120200.1 ornithine decarboxylase 1-like [Schistocerca piceifrons]
MKLSNLDERIHVMDAGANVWNIIKDIAESGVQEEAFYVCDIGDIMKKHKEWKLKMPRVQPYYAVKCNDSLTILEVLAALGTSFDCASKAEINKVLSIGVDPSRIIFANPAKPASHIRHAAAVGVDLMTFDNECELHKIKSLFPTAKLVIRIRCDATVAQCQLGMKFGCDPEADAPRLMQIAHLLGLEILGVSFHVGSGCQDPPVFRRAIAAARNLFELGATLGFSMNLLDLGGGYPGIKGSYIDKIAEVINNALEEFFPDPEVHVIAEPGRYYVASAYTLATNVHSKRELINHEDGSITSVMYYVNDGVYGSFNCLLYDHMEVTPIPLNAAGRKIRQCSVWGPTCDGLDQIVERTLLPELEVGDWIVFENMGAYTLPVASPFNGFPVPKVHTVIDDHNWLLLKDLHPMTEEHFVIGSTPANLHLGLDIDGRGNIDEWEEVAMPLAAPDVVANNPVPPASAGPAFLYELVEVGPVS